MPLSDNEHAHHSTYFGVFSAAQAASVSRLLEGLGVRYEFWVQDQSEERLRAWVAWDSDAARPQEGHELFIHSSDLDKVGTRIVEMYPERNYAKD
jgi:hypothetical protein